MRSVACFFCLISTSHRRRGESQLYCTYYGLGICKANTITRDDFQAHKKSSKIVLTKWHLRNRMPHKCLEYQIHSCCTHCTGEYLSVQWNVGVKDKGESRVESGWPTSKVMLDNTYVEVRQSRTTRWGWDKGDIPVYKWLRDSSFCRRTGGCPFLPQSNCSCGRHLRVVVLEGARIILQVRDNMSYDTKRNWGMIHVKKRRQ